MINRILHSRGHFIIAKGPFQNFHMKDPHAESMLLQRCCTLKTLRVTQNRCTEKSIYVTYEQAETHTERNN